MADLTLAVAESHRAPHQTGASHRPPKTRVLESGGQRRENSLNPIVARVRAELVALAAEHSNRPEVVKYSPDQPRDDHGRWTSGGDGPTVESLATQNVTIKNLEAVDPALRRVVLDAAQAFRDRFPPVPLVVQVTPGEQNEIASAQGFMLNLSPEWYGPGAPEQWAVMTPRDRAANWSAEPSPRGTIEHEFGHIIDWMVYHDASDKAFRNAPRYSDTGSGRSEPSERWAEGFSQLWLRPKDEWTPDARIVAKALLAPDVANNIGEQPGTTVYKYDPSQPRGADGRWVLGAGGANAVWSDPNDAWVSGVPASDRRAAEREQYRKAISEALPRAQFLLPGATSSTLKGLAGASTRFAHLFPGAVDSVAGIGMRAVLAPGVMAETRWREGGGLPNGKTTISLGNYYFGDRSSDRVEVGAVRNIMTGWHVPEETGKEEVIAHEFGHVLQAKYPDDYGVATINFAGRQPVSGYGATKPEENFAEMYVRYAYADPANWDETTRSTVALLGWPVPESKVVKFDPSQPRDEDGRWTADDREALEQYGMTSDYLNEQLKEGVPLDTQPRFPLNWSNDELVRQIDGAFSRAKPTSELLTMFRGVGSDEVVGLVPGATLTYPGYVSTTPSRDVAATYGRVVPVIIPAGSRAIDVDAATGLTTFETETLLPRGSTFRYDESGLTFVPDTTQKYNQDQARVPAGNADGGQWTADTSVYGVTIASVTAINRAVETYREAHPRTVIDDSLLRGRPDFIIPALKQMAQLQDQFPNVWIGWVGMQATGTGAFGGSDGGATMAMHFPGRSVPWTPEQKVENDEMATALGLPIEAGDGTRGSSIFLNERYFGADAPDNAFWTPQFGYHPPGVDDAAGIMTHEFGHAVDSTMNEAADLWSDRKMMVWSDWRDDAARRYANPEMGGSLASISTYARIGGFSEAFADLFAAAYSPGTLPYDPKGPPMTARSRLNSETQGYVDTMRSVLADSGATVTKVVKYSESQPRDEAGRWTATGMAATEADPTGAGYQWSDGTVTRWPDLKTAKDEYQKAHPDTLLYLGRLDRVKPVEMMVALDQLDKVQQQFPGVRISEVAIRKDKYENKGTTVASCRQQGVGSASAISLNPAYWAVGGKSLNGYDRGWHPDGVSNPAGYMTHEFGHAVDNYYSTAEPADDREERERVGHWKDMAWDFARPDGRPISGYARTRTNSASVTSEGFAEAFAEAFTPGTPGADQPNALALKDLLTTYGGYVAKVDFFTEGGAVHPIRGSEGYDPVLAGDIDRPATGQYSITTAPYLQTSSYDQVCETCHQTIPAGTAFMRGDWTGGLATFEWHVDHDPVGEWKPEGSDDYSANPAQRELDARTDAPADRTSPFTPEPPPQLRLSADERTLAVENLNRGAAKFARNGGTVEAASSVHKQAEGYAKFQDMVHGGLTGSDLGPNFARTALESGDDVVNIAWTKEGDIAGAHAYDRTERPTELQQLGGDHSLGHGIVGSTGVVPGVGSALTAAYIRHAASENASIVIAPVASAKTFWRSMGMRQLDGGGWGMSADDVKAIAAELD